MGKIEIRTLAPEDWLTYKSVRLASLKDSPDSFGSTYERETLLPDTEWQSRLEPSGLAKDALPLIADYSGNAVGIAWGLVREADLKTAHIYQMWVSPEVRGKGIAKALLDKIVTWAEVRNCKFVGLSVTTSNDAAICLYQSSGFIPSGNIEELREGSALKVQTMVKALRTITSNPAL